MKGNKIIMAAGALLAALQVASAHAVDCGDDEVGVPVTGKIFNNGVQPGLTLGTVHVSVGGQKLKCGILGQGGSADGTINFVHTFVCDDQTVFLPTGDTIHSQLTLNTSGVADVRACLSPPYPLGSTEGTFTEVSVPVPGSGRGIFTGVERGEVVIEGTINCMFSIDMKFAGELCLKAQ